MQLQGHPWFERTGVLVKVSDPLRPPSGSVLQEGFGLTPAEARLACALLAEHGLPPQPYEAMRPIASHGARGLIRLGFGLDRDDSRFEGLRQRFLDLYDTHYADDTVLFDGVPELIDGLARAGARLDDDRLPEPLAPLARLAWNHRWGWTWGAADLFARLDPDRFARLDECPPRNQKPYHQKNKRSGRTTAGLPRWRSRSSGSRSAPSAATPAGRSASPRFCS